MRPEFPSVKRIESEDGLSSLTFEKPSHNRDIPGQIFLFAMANGFDELLARATVCDVTVLWSATAAESEGIDTLNATYDQRFAYLKEYEAKHGRSFEVLEFLVLQKPSDVSIEAMRDAFLGILSELTSSQERAAAQSERNARYFSDAILFRPHNLDAKYYVSMALGETR